VTYAYDDPAKIQSQATTATQHDQSYSSTFLTRANVTGVSRWDVTDITNATKALTTSMSYDAAGSVLTSADPVVGHQTSIAYADSFSDGTNHNTFAYPTAITDADGFSTLLQYNFDFGARTRIAGPPPANQPQGLIQTFAYDTAARIDRITTANNGAYQRFVYGPNYVQQYGSVNNVADDSYAIQVFDGVGRLFATSAYHPGSSGGYRAQLAYHDLMGRAMLQSNPTEITSGWVPAGDDAAGWLFTTQTYDWKGRPLVTTNTDTTTKEASYTGCGCAGGEVVTLTDEGTIDGGVAKRRQQKIYSDVLGRTVKTEVLNWQGGSVYSTTVNSYNARDQLTLVRQYQGAEGSGVYQDTTMTYDAYGRLQTKHVPEQDAGTATTYNYNPDDTAQSVIDARGASQTFSYNGRHLVTGITYSAPAGITPTSNVTYGYDAAGNRTSMNDGTGSCGYNYDQLSRMTSETHTFNGLGSYTLSYDYNLAGELKKITDPTNVSINYSYDQAGRLGGVTGSDNLYGGVSQYAPGVAYRAWGGIKGLNYGNNYTLAVSYNSRLQGTQFEVAGRPAQYGPSTVMKTQFDYYGDGATKYAHDVLDERFDRAYSYDNLTMLKEAYTGSESRDYVNGTSSGTQTGPYRQSYQHDAFGNLNHRDNRFWSRSDSFTASYANNRRAGFSYDFDGRLTQDNDLQYYYDAAGRSASVFDAPINKWLTIVNDGNGQQVKRVETQYGSVISTNYYLRSSVLGGKVITELNQNGQKQKGYVFAGEQVLAEQENNVVKWRHENPLTGSRGGSFANGFFQSGVEADPMGVNVGLVDPFIDPLPEPNPEPFMPTLLGDSGSRGSNPNCTSCYLDGFQIGCDRVGHLIDIGAVALEVTLRNGTRQQVPIRSFGVGLFGVWVPNASNPRGPGYGLSDEVVRVNTFQDDLMGHWQLFSFNFAGQNLADRRTSDPQRPDTPISAKDIYRIYRSIKDIRRYLPVCDNFIKGVLEELGKLNPSNPPVSTDMLEIFRMVQNQPDGGFFKNNSGPSTVSGRIKDGTAKILYGSSPFLYVSRTFHEGFHISGSNHWLFDQAVAKAIGQVDSAYLGRYEAIDPRDKDAYLSYSYLIDNALSTNCAEKDLQK
jgi:YD repeat-containing protein